MLSYVLTKEMWAESFSNNLWEFSTLSIRVTRRSHVTAFTSLSRIQGGGAAKAEIATYTLDRENGSVEVVYLSSRVYGPRDVFGNLVVREWWIAEGKSRIAIDNCLDVTFLLGAGPHTFAHSVCGVFVREYKAKITGIGQLVKDVLSWFSGRSSKHDRADQIDEALRTHVVFDRATGDIVHIHHSVTASDERTLEESQLVADALRLAADLTGRAQADLDTISVCDSDLVRRRRLKVDVTSRQIIAIDGIKGH